MNRIARPLPAMLVVALALGVARPAGAQDMGQRRIDALVAPGQGSAPNALQAVYHRLAAAWASQDARGVARLARGGRVYVVIQRERISQRLAASQLQFLLQELFDTAEEVEFRFPDYVSYDPRAEAGYAIGERVYRNETGADEIVERVFVGVSNERGRWVLTELRLTTE